jgi:hypothetical protein
MPSASWALPWQWCCRRRLTPMQLGEGWKPNGRDRRARGEARQPGPVGDTPSTSPTADCKWMEITPSRTAQRAWTAITAPRSSPSAQRPASQRPFPLASPQCRRARHHPVTPEAGSPVFSPGLPVLVHGCSGMAQARGRKSQSSRPGRGKEMAAAPSPDPSNGESNGASPGASPTLAKVKARVLARVVATSRRLAGQR